MKIKIIGAGLSGLLAYNFFKNEEIVIFEKNKEENMKFNHNAILRTKNEEFPRMLGIDYEEVELEKNYLFENKLYLNTTIEMKNNYSMKVSDRLFKRSLNKEYNSRKRFIFDISTINYDKYKIVYGCNIDKRENLGDCDFCISTIPMNSAGKIFNINIKENFNMKDIFITLIYLNIDSELHQTICDCNDLSYIYRMTLNRRIITIESIGEIKERNIFEGIKYFGLSVNNISEIKNAIQKNGKIFEISDDIRKAFLLELTLKYNVYSLGRYAIWKPKLMLDDLLSDLYKIRKMMNISKERKIYENYVN
jgi:hypothetical protein